MPRTPIGDTVGDWIKLTDLVSPQTVAGDPFLSEVRGKLAASLEEVKRLIVERDELEARKQAATRRINELQEAGRKQASLLRAGLRHELGKSNDRLAAFGIQPYRGRKRSRKVPASGGASPEAQGGSDPSASGSAAE
jgi:hypothetical protein